MVASRAPIHLDTNYLILAVAGDEAVERQLTHWVQRGETLAVSAIAWAEFLVNPIAPDVMSRLEDLMSGGIVPFERAEVESAALAFRALGLKRQNRSDSFIAATAMMAGARLATHNQRDFQRFVPLGLKLA